MQTIFVLPANTKAFCKVLIVRMSTFDSRSNESFTYSNFNDVTISGKSFSNERRSNQGDGNFVDLKPTVSFILLLNFCWLK